MMSDEKHSNQPFFELLSGRVFVKQLNHLYNGTIVKRVLNV